MESVETRVEPELPPLGPGCDLRDRDLRGASLCGTDLTRADLSGADLTGANLTGTVLVEANLHGAILDDARLLHADLSRCDLSGGRARGAVLGGATLDEAVLFGVDLTGASLSQASLRNCDVRTAHLEGVRLVSADLAGCDLSRATFDGADLTDALLRDATLRDADLNGSTLRGVRDAATADWIGAAFATADFTGAYLARREAVDQNYLHEFRGQSRAHEFLYRAWWVTSDCGRSPLRWGLWTFAFALVFAGLYQLVDIDYGASETALSSFYFSIVTLTTLGYGDVLPASQAAQTVVILQVVIGYVMLGGLLSIFATKMGRRGE